MKPRRRRPRPDAEGAATERPAIRSLADAGLDPPPQGRLLAVVVSSPRCEPCSRVLRRLERFSDVDRVVLDVDDPTVVPAEARPERIPQLTLFDPKEDAVRTWIGEPLAGTLEETVRAWRSHAVEDPGQ